MKSHGNLRMKTFYNKSTSMGELGGTKFCNNLEKVQSYRWIKDLGKNQLKDWG